MGSGGVQSDTANVSGIKDEWLAQSACWTEIRTQDLSESSDNVLSGCDENMFVFDLVFKWFVLILIWILLAE